MPRHHTRRLFCGSAAVALAGAIVAAASSLGGPMPGPLPLFPPSNWWNLDVSSAPVDPGSAGFISFLGTTRRMHPDFGGDAGGVQIYGFPYAIVDSTVAKQTVHFQYSDESDGVNHGTDQSFPFYPIPPEAITQPHWIESGEPGNVDLRGSSDRHILIVDKDARKLYELYNVFYDGSQWQAGSGAAFDLDSNTRRPDGWTSADAAGLAILPGLIRYDEVFGTGEINHAFRVTVRATNGYVYPASHRAGSTTGALPMGARLRLKASKDLSGFRPEVQKIFRAMQKYGLIVADNGSDLYVSGTYDTRWNNDILNPAFAALTGADFDVVKLGIREASTVTADSATPNAGSGTTQTFALSYSDSAGATDIATAWAWFSTSSTASVANSCLLYYNRSSNQMFLLNDAATTWMSATVGASGSLSNTQCAIALGASTTAVSSGNTLTLNAALTFKPAFNGAKNLYLYAAGSSGGSSGWQARGTWTVSTTAATVTADSVSPNAGSGLAQTFALQYSDTAGASDLSTAWAWFSPALTSSLANSCLIYYGRAANTVFLLNDAGTAWTSGVAGSSGTLRNAQCAIALSGSSATASGTALTLNLAMTFTSAFAGSKSVYLYAANGTGVASGWQTRGSWTIPTGTTTVTADNVTPPSGSGSAQTFAIQVSDSAGATDLSTAWVWFNSSLTGSAASSCLLYLDRAHGTLFLLNDAAGAWTGAAIGSGTTLQNGQCAVALSTASATASGTTLTLTLPMTFKPAYAGAKNVYLFGASTGGANSGWQQRGTWTIQ